MAARLAAVLTVLPTVFQPRASFRQFRGDYFRSCLANEALGDSKALKGEVGLLSTLLPSLANFVCLH